MDKNEFARRELPNIIGRTRACTEPLHDRDIDDALFRAENTMKYDVPRAVGYLEQICAMSATSNIQKYAGSVIGDFVKKYNNCGQGADVGALAIIVSKIDDLAVRVAKLEKANSVQPNINVVCTNQQNQSASCS